MDDAVATADEHFTSWHVAVADDVSIDIDDDDDDMTAAAAAAAASNAGNYLDYDTSTPHHTERYLLEHYEVKAQVGKGAFGSAHVAVCKTTHRAYVLKRVRLARQSERQRAASYLEMALASSLRHAHVIHFKEAWVEKGHTICMVLSYCEGGDLAALLQRRANAKRHFSEAQIKKWIAQTLLGVEYIHGAGVLHRDLKSSNLFITADGDLQIGDFGLAKVLTSTQQSSRSLVGTPNYMCPEHFYHKAYGTKGDVWSLGCIYYEMAALRPAFSAFNMAGLVAKIKKASVSPLPTAYQSGMSDLIIKGMLRKHPENRLSSTELLSHEYMVAASEAARGNADALRESMLYSGEWPPACALPPGGRSGSPDPGERESAPSSSATKARTSPSAAAAPPKPSPRTTAAAAPTAARATTGVTRPASSPRVSTTRSPTPRTTTTPASATRAPTPRATATSRATPASTRPTSARGTPTTPSSPTNNATLEARKRHLEESSRLLQERQAERRRKREEDAAATSARASAATSTRPASARGTPSSSSKPPAPSSGMPRWAQPTAAAAARVATAARRAISGTADIARRATSARAGSTTTATRRTAAPSASVASPRAKSASTTSATTSSATAAEVTATRKTGARRELLPTREDSADALAAEAAGSKRGRDAAGLASDEEAEENGGLIPPDVAGSGFFGLESGDEQLETGSFAHHESQASIYSMGVGSQPFDSINRPDSMHNVSQTGSQVSDEEGSQAETDQLSSSTAVSGMAPAPAAGANGSSLGWPFATSTENQATPSPQLNGGESKLAHTNARTLPPPPPPPTATVPAAPNAPLASVLTTPSSPPRAPSSGASTPTAGTPMAGMSPSREERIENPFLSEEYRSAAAHSTLLDRVKRLEDTVSLAAKLLRVGRNQELRQVLAGAASKGGVLCPISFASAPPGSTSASATTTSTSDATQACLALSGELPFPEPLRGPFQLGDRVVVGRRRKLSGHIRYYGATAFGDNDYWVGIELEAPEGRNSGVVQGVRYFPCKPNCGLFVRAAVWESNAVRNEQ